MNFKPLISPLIIIGLLVIIFLQRSCGPTPPAPKPPKIDTVKIHDTIYIHDTIKGDPQLVYSKPIVKWVDSSKYRPDTNYAKLLKQYDSLGNEYFSKNIYKTPYKLKSYGNAVVTDTVLADRLIGSSIDFDIKVPIVDNIVTIHDPYKPKNQLYVGIDLLGNKIDLIKSAGVGLILKTKQDHIYQFRVEKFIDGVTPLSYSVGTYWKIKLR